MQLIALSEADQVLSLTLKGSKKELPKNVDFKSTRNQHRCAIPVSDNDRLFAVGKVVTYDVDSVEAAEEDTPYTTWVQNFIPAAQGGVLEDEVDEEEEEDDLDEDDDTDEDDLDEDDDTDEDEEDDDLDDEEEEDEDEDEDKDDEEEDEDTDEIDTVLAGSAKLIGAHVKDVDEVEYLNELSGREGAGKARKTVLKVIDARIAELEEEDEDEEPDERAELEATPIGTLRKKAKELGHSGAGKKVDLIDRILSGPAAEEPEPEPPKRKAKSAKKAPPARKKKKSGRGEVAASRAARSKKAPKKAPKKPRAKAEPKEDPIKVELTKRIADIEDDLRELYELAGARRTKLAIGDLLASFDPTARLAAKHGVGRFSRYTVPGETYTVVKRPKRRPDGADWGTCEYKVRCEDDGGFTLIGFTGSRPDVKRAAKKRTKFKDANALLRLLTKRDYPRVQFYKFFELDKEEQVRKTRAAL